MARRLAPLALALVAALALLAPAGAGARKRKNTWATVNVCDTVRHPDDLGVRARAAGNGSRQRIWMRFLAQYRDDAGHWKQADATGWRRVGSARYAYQETGFTFDFDMTDQPTADYLMRGVVWVQWRRHGKVKKRKRLVTHAHHPSVDSDPKGYSAATCHIRGPLA